ncbi:MAG: HAD family phosphatase [Neisseriales bacterium]|jgi:HAD superfamily hydrolase (TIGR01509 family)|nr:MAG: HAD family phosphatase [Neisseriales bacterium]HRG62428.1 HAD family phosphatase [Burkholderiales bacterium]
MQTISTVFWDLDGTLIDSEHLHMQSGDYATQILEQELQLKATPLNRDMTGMENRAVFDLLFGNAKLTNSQEAFERWQRLAIDFFLDRVDSSQQIKQSIELVKHFSAQGIMQSVVSNSTKEVIAHSLAQLGILDHYSQIFSRDQVERGKPHPEIYLSALTYHRQAPENCLVFEDSATGITAAKAAGLNVVGIGDATLNHNPTHTLSLDKNNWLELLSVHYTF